MAASIDRRASGKIVASVAVREAKRRGLWEKPAEYRDPVTGQWRYVTSRDMLEIERGMDTPEERQRLLDEFERDVRRAQGEPARLERRPPTFRVTIHKRPPEQYEMGVTEGFDPYATGEKRRE